MRGLALLWLCVILFAPGLGAMLALFRPGQLGLAARLAVTFGLGYAVVGIIAYVLTVLQVMRIVPFFVLLAAMTTALWYLAARRSSLREQGRAAVEEVRSDPWSIGLGLVVIAAIAAIRLTFLDHFPIIAPFRYWVDGLEIADAGRIPSLTLHYGTLYPPATSKVLLNSFNAGVSFSLGQDSPAALAALSWVASVGLAVGLWAVGRELGLRFTAALLPVLLIANRLVLSKEMTLDMSSYKAEVFGRMVAVSALVLAVRALRNRTARTDAMVAGGLLAAAAGTHLVPVLVVVVFLGWYAVCLLAVERDLSGLLRQGLAIGLTLGVVGGTLLLLPRGDIGLQGAERPEEYDQVDRGFDETQYLYTGRMIAPRGPVKWFLVPRRVINAYMVRTFNLSPQGDADYTFAIVTSLTCLAVALAMLFLFPRPLRPLGPAALGLGGTLVFLALAFSYRYDVYVPAWFGVRRLFEYGAVPVVLLGLALVEGGLHLVSRRWPGREVFVAAVVVLVVSALVLPSSRAGPENAINAGRVVPLMDWIRRETDCDARILANQRTVGIFRGLTGRAGVLEGMGPFLRPDMLEDVVDVMLSARDFFADPAANQEFLVERGVDYVVVLREARIGYGGPIGKFDPSGLENVSFLRLANSTPAFSIYRVEGLPPGPDLVDATGQPGYRCTREPLVLSASR